MKPSLGMLLDWLERLELQDQAAELTAFRLSAAPGAAMACYQQSTAGM
jgi:hypothetical protein